MQLGRVFAFVFIMLGGFLSYMNYTMIRDSGYTFKLLMAGPALIGVGIMMFIFPGGNITAAESKSRQKDPKTVTSEAPLLHKIMWGAGALAGLAVNAIFFKTV